MARSLSNPTVAHQPKPVVKEKEFQRGFIFETEG